MNKKFICFLIVIVSVAFVGLFEIVTYKNTGSFRYFEIMYKAR